MAKMLEMINKIYCEDCLETMKRMPDKSIDLVLTDPPYGIGMDGGNVGYKGFNNFKKKGWDNQTPSQEIFDEIFRISKHQIIWGGNYFNLRPSRCFIVWDKGEGFKNRTFAEGELAWCSFDSNLKIYKRDPLARGDYKGKLHPTQKPIQVIEFCVNYAINIDNTIKTIYDPFSGSGTTLVCAKSKGLDYIGSELDKDYYEIIQKRLQTVQGSLF